MPCALSKQSEGPDFFESVPPLCISLRRSREWDRFNIINFWLVINGIELLFNAQKLNSLSIWTVRLPHSRLLMRCENFLPHLG